MNNFLLTFLDEEIEYEYLYKDIDKNKSLFKFIMAIMFILVIIIALLVILMDHFDLTLLIILGITLSVLFPLAYLGN